MVQKSLDLPKSAYKSLAIVYDVSYVCMYVFMYESGMKLTLELKLYEYMHHTRVLFSSAHWQSFKLCYLYDGVQS